MNKKEFGDHPKTYNFQLGGQLVKIKPKFLFIIQLLIIGGFFLLDQTACSTIDPKAASRLAAKGTEFAQAMESAANSRQAALHTYLEGQVLLSGLDPRFPEPTESLKKSLDRVFQAIRLRGSLMSDLGQTYLQFSNLALYEAAAEVEKAAGSLHAAINEYGQTITPGEGNVIGDTAGRITAKGLGLLARYKQSRQLQEGSIVLREALVEIAELFEKEKALHTAIDEEIVSGGGKTAVALWKIGLGIPSDIVKDHLGNFGLEFKESQLVSLKNDQLTDAIEKVLNLRVEQQRHLQESLINQQIAGIHSLIGQHQKLEKEEVLSLETVSGHLLLLKGLAEEVKNMQHAEAE